MNFIEFKKETIEHLLFKNFNLSKKDYAVVRAKYNSDLLCFVKLIKPINLLSLKNTYVIKQTSAFLYDDSDQTNIDIVEKVLEAEKRLLLFAQDNPIHEKKFDAITVEIYSTKESLILDVKKIFNPNTSKDFREIFSYKEEYIMIRDQGHFEEKLKEFIEQ